MAKTSKEVRIDLLERVDAEIDHLAGNEMASIESRAMSLRTLSETLINIVNMEQDDRDEDDET